MSLYTDSSYEFTWDEKKAIANFAKHKITFDEGKTIFKDPFLITYPDKTHSKNENRFISIGISAKERLLLVVHLEESETPTGITLRIISCRKATTTERKAYEEDR